MAAHHWTYKAELPAGLEHSVQVQTDSPTADFNLLILDRAGNVLVADRGPEAGAQCSIRTTRALSVVFVVELVSGSGSFSLQVASQPMKETRQSQKPAPRRERSNPGSKSAAPAADHSGSNLTGAERDQLLAAHNDWRARVGVAALKWSDELAAYAQHWADELEATGMRMRHRSPNRFGENLYWCSGKSARPAEVVDAWGSEQSLYDYEANNWWPDAGHFSQLVWHDTTEVGGAVVRSGGQELWVCNYNLRGNWTGKRPYRL